MSRRINFNDASRSYLNRIKRNLRQKLFALQAEALRPKSKEKFIEVLTLCFLGKTLKKLFNVLYIAVPVFKTSCDLINIIRNQILIVYKIFSINTIHNIFK